MSKNKKINNFSDKFIEAGKHLESLFPQKNIKIGLHTSAKSLYEMGYIKKPNMSAVSACVEVRDDSLSLRIFRPGNEGPTYKIDMIEGIDKKISTILDKSAFDHYIYTNIPENIMERNNISIECVIDKKGELVPKINTDGMMDAFINFEPPVNKFFP